MFLLLLRLESLETELRSWALGDFLISLNNVNLNLGHLIRVQSAQNASLASASLGS